MPAELRARIYALVLPKKEGVVNIHICHSTKHRVSYYRVMHQGHFLAKWTREKHKDIGSCEIRSKQSPGRTRSNLSPVAILYACRTTYLEGFPHLYENHKFRFEDTTGLRHFLEYLGPASVQHLRHIEIASQGIVKNTTVSTFRLLQPATKLQRLVIDHENLCPGPQYLLARRQRVNCDRIAQLVEPMLKALHDSHTRSGQGKSTTVLDLVKIEIGDSCRGRNSICSLEEFDELQTAKIRSIVAAYLKIADSN